MFTKYKLLWMVVFLCSSYVLEAQKKPVFLDNFDDNNANGWTTHGGSWSMEMQDLNEPHFTYRINSGAFDKATIPVPAINDFFVEGDIKLYGGQASILFCVANPGVGPDNFQGYSMGIDAAGFVWLGKHNNSWLELGRGPQQVYLEQPYYLRAEKQGSSIKVYVNGILKISATDSSFPSCNMVGVRGGVNNSATFDHIIVRPLGDDLLGSTFTYKNPYVPYPLLRDPQILKEGDTYYLIGTAAPHFFGDCPGVPIYASKNLIDWQFVKFLIERNPSKWYNNRFWAPEVNKINGKYYLMFNCFFPYYGTGDTRNGPPQGALAVSNSLLGPYTVLTESGPWTNQNDGSLFQDTDGKTYLFQGGITASEVDLNAARLVGNWWDVAPPDQRPGQWDSQWFGNEGPTVVKKDGIYYCFYSAWGRGYEVGVATATNIRGPWTKLPNNPVLGGQEEANCIRSGAPYTQHPSVPYRSAGHNSIFTGPDGGDWVIAHLEMKGGPPQLWIDPIQIGGGRVSTTSNNPVKATAPSWEWQTVNLTPGVQTPFPGPGRAAIPGVIEAENFDGGGEGTAYHDANSGNIGGAYRTSEGVDIELCAEGGHNLAWSVSGEWTEYSVNVTKAGKYRLDARVASPIGGSFHIEFGGVNVTGTLTAPNTTAWQTWQTVSKEVTLSAGEQIMRFYIDQQEFNTNKFTFTLVDGPPPTTDDIVSGAIYKIIGKQSGKAIDVEGVSLNAGAPIHLWSDHGGANQRWKVENAGNGFYKLTAQHSNKCLDLPNGSLENGVRIVQWDCWAGDMQQWKLQKDAEGFYSISAKITGKCLDVVNFQTTDGSIIAQYPCNATFDNQKWKFVRVDAGARLAPEEGAALSSKLQMYPNPAEGSVSVDLRSLSNESVSISIIDTKGEQVLSEKAKGGKNISLNTSKLKAGVYTVILKNRKSLVRQRLVIKR